MDRDQQEENVKVATTPTSSASSDKDEENRNTSTSMEMEQPEKDDDILTQRYRAAMERSNAFAALVLMENNLPPSSQQQVTVSERRISSLALDTSELLADSEQPADTEIAPERKMDTAVGSSAAPTDLCGQQRAESDGSGKN